VIAQVTKTAARQIVLDFNKGSGASQGAPDLQKYLDAQALVSRTAIQVSGVLACPDGSVGRNLAAGVVDSAAAVAMEVGPQSELAVRFEVGDVCGHPSIQR
jgi:hypothetical protein